MANAHPFLSDEWLVEARRIREDYEGQVEAGAQPIRMNQVITDVPFGEGIIHSHLDSSSGAMDIDTGHLDAPDVTVTLDYETAKIIFVDGNFQAGMQAFMEGRVKVQGDLAKLIAVQQQQQTAPSPRAAEVQQRIKEITA